MYLHARLAPLRRPLVVWLALLIAVLGAITPTLARAMVAAHAGTEPGFVVCTQTGPRWVALTDSPDSPDGQESALHIEHCPFCLLFTDCVAPPPHVLIHLFAVSGGFKVSTVRQAFFFHASYALTPPPRGPPVSF
jgi:hypothetical protein